MLVDILLELTVRDFVASWYKVSEGGSISDDDHWLNVLKLTLSNMVGFLAYRSKRINIMAFVTDDVTEIIYEHLAVRVLSLLFFLYDSMEAMLILSYACSHCRFFESCESELVPIAQSYLQTTLMNSFLSEFVVDREESYPMKS